MTLVISDSKSQTKKEVYPVGWYVLSVSSQIKSRPVGIRRLGIDLVLWRDEKGKIVCQSRHCPHRGVDLALGKIAQQNGKSCLECPYHGFRFAGNGSCLLIPCNGEDSRISPKMRVESYRVEESQDSRTKLYFPTYLFLILVWVESSCLRPLLQLMKIKLGSGFDITFPLVYLGLVVGLRKLLYGLN